MNTSVFTLQTQGIRINRDGRDYAVAPCVMLVTPGVYNGELVPTAEIALFAQSWNDAPIVISHPRDGEGNAISAKGLNINRVGRVYDAALDGGKLKGNLWIDIDAASSAGASEVVDNILNGNLVEVSTGYFRVFDPTPGMLDGKSYQGITRHVVPDHLALLPNQRGACSIEGGCGVPRTNSTSHTPSLASDVNTLIANQSTPAFLHAFENMIKGIISQQIESDELDLQRRTSIIYGAWWDQEQPGYPLFVFDTYVVAADDTSVVRVPYEISATDGVYGVAFGQPIPVRMSFEPVTTGTTDSASTETPQENTMRESIIQLLHARTGAELSELESKSDVELLDAMLGTVQTAPATNEQTPCAELSERIAQLGGVNSVLDAFTALYQQHAEERTRVLAAAQAATGIAMSDLEALPDAALQKLALPRNFAGQAPATPKLDDAVIEYRTI